MTEPDSDRGNVDGSAPDEVAFVEPGGNGAVLAELAEGPLDLTCPDTAALAQLSQHLSRHAGIRAVHTDPATLTVGVATDGSAAQVRALLDAADPDRVLVAGFAVHDVTLDDVFLSLTGHATETAHV